MRWAHSAGRGTGELTMQGWVLVSSQCREGYTGELTVQGGVHWWAHSAGRVTGELTVQGWVQVSSKCREGYTGELTVQGGVHWWAHSAGRGTGELTVQGGVHWWAHSAGRGTGELTVQGGVHWWAHSAGRGGTQVSMQQEGSLCNINGQWQDIINALQCNGYHAEISSVWCRWAQWLALKKETGPLMASHSVAPHAKTSQLVHDKWLTVEQGVSHVLLQDEVSWVIARVMQKGFCAGLDECRTNKPDITGISLIRCPPELHGTTQVHFPPG